MQATIVAQRQELEQLREKLTPKSKADEPTPDCEVFIYPCQEKEEKNEACSETGP